MPTALLLYDILRDEERLLLKALERFFRVKPLHVPSATMKMGSAAEAEVALERCVGFHRAIASAAAAESWGVRTVNSPLAIAVAGDKVLTTLALLRSGVPIPRTVLAFSVEGLVKAAKEVGYPAVVKPVHGSWGRLLALVNDEETARAIAEHRELLGPAYRVHYVQELVRKPGRDIRSMCIGDAVPVAIYRVSSHWITNTARGARAEPAPVTPELEDVTLRACRAVGVEVGGVDIVEDPERGLLVLEVNAVPEFKNIVRVTGFDVAGAIASYAYGLAKR